MNKSLHVVQTFGLYDVEGRTGHVSHLTQSLLKRNHIPEIIAPAYQTNYPKDIEVNQVRITYLKSIARYRSLTLNIGAADHLIKRITNVDLVHIHGLYDLLGPVASQACLKIGKPYIVETMGMLLPFGRGFLMKRIYMELMGKTMLKNAARYVVTSNMEAKQLEVAGFDPSKISVRHNGVEVISSPTLDEIASFRKKHGIVAEFHKVVFLGRIAPVKNLEKLIREFYILDKAKTLLILGGPVENLGYLNKLKSLINSLNLESKVIWTGPVYGTEKSCLLFDADIFALTSINENFGIAAAEAMTAGVPVIATNTCGITEYFGDNAGLALDLSKDSLATVMSELLDNKDLRSEIGINGKESVKLLTWDSAAQLTAQMYKEIVN